MKRNKLRSGYTTGACAAAAAKAAVMLLLNPKSEIRNPIFIDIPFPDGSRHKFRGRGQNALAWASVVKDAGDDPDVTNGAEIVAEARIQGAGGRACPDSSGGQGAGKTTRSGGINLQLATCNLQLIIKGGKGVGVVTKPGLPVPIGEPAINPVPRRMIEEAVMEAVEDSYKLQACPDPFIGGTSDKRPAPYPPDESGQALPPTPYTLEVTISVPNGEELAKKTLNSRLGITGGISILGTTGIVKPVSTEAWTATISSSMDVAKATGHAVIVLSAGRTSEKAHIKKFNLPEEVYVLMGDHLEYSLKEARRHGFKKIHLCAQWAKMVKIAMATPQTHVKFGAIDIRKAVKFLSDSGQWTVDRKKTFNTAREIYDLINLSLAPPIKDSGQACPLPLFSKVCSAARDYAEQITGGVPVTAYLVSYEGEIISESE